MADWGKCHQDLYWSANHGNENWKKHGNALMERSSNEPNAFAILKGIQGHNDGAQKNYEDCRNSNLEQFWTHAKDVWSSDGPRLDCVIEVIYTVPPSVSDAATRIIQKFSHV